MRRFRLSPITIVSVTLEACSSSHATPSGPALVTGVKQRVIAQLHTRPLRLPSFPGGLCLTTAGQPADRFSTFGTSFTLETGPVYPILGEYQPNTEDGSLGVGQSCGDENNSPGDSASCKRSHCGQASPWALRGDRRLRDGDQSVDK
jgi:hypothetical protein